MMETDLQAVTRWGRVPAWWLRHPAVDADRFSVLSALATYADEAGECDPSQATIARWLQRSRPWVNRVVAQLSEEGFLEKISRARRNGGTTSCLYRLRLAPFGTQQSPGAVVTGGVAPQHSPRHQPDRNQPEAEQNHAPCPNGRAVREKIAGRRGEDASAAEAFSDSTDHAAPSEDWLPDEATLARARRLCPDADLAAHTAHFVARCRAKNYRYSYHALGDAWLSWLLEDRRRDANRIEKAAPSSVNVPRRPAPSPAARADERLAAWAAASHPRHPWS